MEKTRLETVLETKIQPAIDDAMKRFLGARISEIKGEISDKIRKSPLLGMSVEFSLSFKEAKKKFKQTFLEKLLNIKHGNISEVARLTGVDRRSIHRIVSKKKSQKIRKDLLKPYYLKQKEVEGIISEVVKNYEGVIRQEKIEKFYDATPQISKDIAEELPDSEITLKEAEEEFEKIYLQRKLEENDFDSNKTAHKIRLRYETLMRKIKKHGLKNS
jgi:DNA-binding NtrC family response regulator